MCDTPRWRAHFPVFNVFPFLSTSLLQFLLAPLSFRFPPRSQPLLYFSSSQFQDPNFTSCSRLTERCLSDLDSSHFKAPAEAPLSSYFGFLSLHLSCSLLPCSDSPSHTRRAPLSSSPAECRPAGLMRRPVSRGAETGSIVTYTRKHTYLKTAMGLT